MPYSKGKYPNKKRKTTDSHVRRLEARIKAIEHATELKEKSFISIAEFTSAQTSEEYGKDGKVSIISTLAEGTGGTDGERVGSVVKWKKMFIRHCNRFEGLNPNYRTAIVWDRQGVGAPSYTEIFKDDTLLDGDKPLSGVNLKNRERFTVLYDNINSEHKNARMQLTLGTTGGTFVEVVRETGEHYIDLSPEKYTSVFEDTNTIPTTGQLLLVTVGNTLAASGDPAGPVKGMTRYINLNIRMRYTDA